MNLRELRRWAPHVLTALCVIQFAVPGYMIVRREHALSAGRAFKFRTAPVDPYDAYRGRYVALNFEAATVKGVPPPPEAKDGQRVYALLGDDEKGFARVTGLSLAKPSGVPYVRAVMRYPSKDGVSLELPFERYYMEEDKAPLAESAYRRRSPRQSADAYAVVRILGAQAVIEELFIDGVPIRNFLAKAGAAP